MSEFRTSVKPRFKVMSIIFAVALVALYWADQTFSRNPSPWFVLPLALFVALRLIVWFRASPSPIIITDEKVVFRHLVNIEYSFADIEGVEEVRERLRLKLGPKYKHMSAHVPRNVVHESPDVIRTEIEKRLRTR